VELIGFESQSQGGFLNGVLAEGSGGLGCRSAWWVMALIDCGFQFGFESKLEGYPFGWCREVLGAG
jgi:hypothetical protein